MSRGLGQVQRRALDFMRSVDREVTVGEVVAAIFGAPVTNTPFGWVSHERAQYESTRRALDALRRRRVILKHTFSFGQVTYRLPEPTAKAVMPTIVMLPDERTPEQRAADNAGIPVANANRCLTCGWVTPGGIYPFDEKRIFPMRRHYKAEHPGAWDDPNRAKGTFLYEQVFLNEAGQVIFGANGKPEQRSGGEGPLRL